MAVASTPGPDAEALARRGQVYAAVQAAQQQMAESPNDVENLELYVDLLLNVGMAVRAEDEFAQRLRAAPDRPDNHYLLGRALADVRHAREAYENALRLDPDHARSHMGVAAVYVALGQPAPALDAYRRAVTLDPQLTEAWLGQVRLHAQAGDEAKAAAVAAEGLAAVPNDPGLALAVATLIPERAATVLPKAVAQTPDDAPLLAAYAAQLLATGDAERAEMAAKQALLIDPTHGEARRIAWIASDIAAQRLTAAQAVRAEAAAGKPKKLDQLVEEAPRSIVVRLLRAQDHRTNGDLEAAVLHLQKALEVDGAHPEANAAAGQALLQLGRPQQAAPLLSIAAAASPWDAALQVTWASAMQQAGQRSKALGVLAKLAKERPLNVVVQGAYAQALVDAGRAEEAYQAIRKALLLLPDPRLAAAFIMVATEAGHHEEAAALLDTIADTTGNEAMRAKAQALRQR